MDRKFEKKLIDHKKAREAIEQGMAEYAETKKNNGRYVPKNPSRGLDRK